MKKLLLTAALAASFITSAEAMEEAREDKYTLTIKAFPSKEVLIEALKEREATKGDKSKPLVFTDPNTHNTWSMSNCESYHFGYSPQDQKEIGHDPLPASRLPSYQLTYNTAREDTSWALAQFHIEGDGANAFCVRLKLKEEK